MTEQELREKIAKVHRCWRNCRLYPSLCRKFSRCKVERDKEDYEITEIIVALVKEWLKEAGVKLAK